MVEDGREVALGEAPRPGCGGERDLDPLAPDERREFHRAGHLGADPDRACRRRLDEPGLGARPEGEEGDLARGDGARPGSPGATALGMVGIVGRLGSGPPGRRAGVAGDLGESAWRPGDDHDLVAADPHPDFRADERAGNRVADRAQADRQVVGHRAGLAERRGVRLGGQDVEVRALEREQVVGAPGGLPVDPPVHLGAEHGAGGREVGEARIRRQQVRLGGDEVGLGDLDRALAAALALGIERDAGGDLDPAMPAGGNDLGVADPDAGDPLDRDRPLVVGQDVRRRAAERAEGRIEADTGARGRGCAGAHRRCRHEPGRPSARRAPRP